ncbi:hypothetical protein DLJ53_05205 [Acuticoccus sediminis]|uniref:Lectin-like protein BA14k n=2 Tax=Acuticoccus sediminis TaxID=2184697 RepID=A0A8B2NYS3_9HYPH|nr:hypothetical protein DLJ53_05205 [Acuticoccus sediminis]
MQRTGKVASLCAAMAMMVPLGAHASQIPGVPVEATFAPSLADPVATSVASMADEGIQVAQTRRELERRNRALRYNNQNLRHRNRHLANRPDRVYRNNRWYYRRGGYYYDNTGAVLAGALIAGTAGLVAGSALANSSRTVVVQQPTYAVAAPYSAEWYRQCDLKYNSFRASDGTYLGYDGYRHTCRLP